jgi:intein/homing endonuclease
MLNFLNNLIPGQNKEEKKTKQKDKKSQKKKTPPTKKSNQNKSKFERGLVSVKDVIAPSAIEVDFDWIRINNRYYRTLFIVDYPRFVSANWLSSLINFDHSLDISMNVYPTEGKEILDDLRRKIAEMEAEISSDVQRGKVVNPGTKAKLEDALALQEQLVKGVEKFFQFGLYITIGAKSVDQLNQITKELESNLGSLLIIPKHATLQMEAGFKTTLPIGEDKLEVTRNMDTTSLASTFPFVSSDLSDDKGIMYGINQHNGSLVIFDRFSMPNYNSTIFATSGAGKSISGDDPVLIKQKGKVKLIKAKKIVNKLIDKHGATQLEPEIEGVVNPPQLEVYTFDKNLKGQWSKVTVAARKNAPDRLYKITTSSGREITITKDHNLVTLKNNKVQTLKGDQAKKGDSIPLPRRINNPKTKETKINLVELLKNNPKAYLHHAAPIIKTLRKKLKNKNHPKCRYLYKYAQTRAIPLRFFSWLCEQTNYQQDLKNVKLGDCKNELTKLPINLTVDADFAFLLGLIVAEGTVTKDFVCITSGNQKLLEKAKQIITQYGFSYFHANNQEIRISNTLFAQIIIELGIGQRAENKQVPNIIFESPNHIIASFLKAYFEGDGGVENHNISATSKSKQLISQLTYLLKYFGIQARVKPTYKSATNVMNKKKKEYWRLNIYNQNNLTKFKNKINFFSARKIKLLNKITNKKEHTNVDTVPITKETFEELINLLYPEQRIKTSKIMNGLKSGSFSPSRKTVHKIINFAEQRINQLEQWQRETKPKIDQLPNLDNLISNVSNNKELNHRAWQKLSSSWATIKNKSFTPQTKNTFILNEIASQTRLTPQGVYENIQKSFQVLGLYQNDFDEFFFSALRENPKADISYKKVHKAKNYILEKWQKRKKQILKAKEIISQLKLLANSQLEWDQVEKIEKIENKNPYVYDFTVDNEIFLAGYNGMFVHNSYLVKLEALRSLMFGTEVIVIDPENEYENLAEAVGGQYITFGFDADAKINPFDLEISPEKKKDETELGRKILSLHSLFKLIMGELEPEEDAILDRALVQTYKMRGITPGMDSYEDKEMPLMEDLYKVLIGMEEPQASSLAARLEKFIKGSFAGLFNAQTNVDIDNKMVVFGIRDLEEKLRPIAMHIILDFIWNKVRREMKKRLLVVDEAWYLMKYPDSARFLYGLAKRARKYYLGITNITQDVDDFLGSQYGAAIVKNSSIRVLLKQHPAAIDQIAEIFYLSEGEKQMLLSADVGEGIFFAGRNHVAIKVVASQNEHNLITSDPEEILQMKKKAENGKL